MKCCKSIRNGSAVVQKILKATVTRNKFLYKRKLQKKSTTIITNMQNKTKHFNSVSISSAVVPKTTERKNSHMHYTLLLEMENNYLIHYNMQTKST